MEDKIGDFLIKIGAMTRVQVIEVLQCQALGDKRVFGEIATEMGFIEDDAIQRYVAFMESHDDE